MCVVWWWKVLESVLVVSTSRVRLAGALRGALPRAPEAFCQKSEFKTLAVLGKRFKRLLL